MRAGDVNRADAILVGEDQAFHGLSVSFAEVGEMKVDRGSSSTVEAKPKPVWVGVDVNHPP